MKKQRSASPSQAMPRSAPVSADLVDDEAAVLLEQRVGLVVGELAVRLPVGALLLEREAGRGSGRPSGRPCRCRRRARPSCGLIASGSMKPSASLAERRRAMSSVVISPGSSAGGPGSPSITRSRSSPMPESPGQRERAALDELRARVGLRVVRGGAHQPAVELARADRPVEHLGADHPDVEHVGALVGDAARVLRRPCAGADRRMSRPRRSVSSLRQACPGAPRAPARTRARCGRRAPRPSGRGRCPRTS